MPIAIREIIQKMIDANEPEENIAAIIRKHKGKTTIEPSIEPVARQQPGMGDTGKTSADTFMGGFGNSLAFGSGGAADAGIQGGLGWLKGATLDLPGSIASGLSTIGGMITSPRETLRGIKKGARPAASAMWDTATHAGSDPDSFGRMMGQLTGQPLVTEGLVRGAPPVLKAIGKEAAPAIEKTGELMRDYQPITGFPPKILVGRTFRNIEGWAGGKLADIGHSMRGPAEGQVMPPTTYTPNFKEGQVVSPTPPVRKSLNPSKVSFYHGGAGPEVPMDPQSPTAFRHSNASAPNQKLLPASTVDHYLPESSVPFEPVIPETPIQTPIQTPSKLKVKLNSDGTYTDLTTGEILDDTGRSVAPAQPTELTRPPVHDINAMIQNNPSLGTESNLMSEPALPKIAESIANPTTSIEPQFTGGGTAGQQFGDKVTKARAMKKWNNPITPKSTPESFGNNFFKKATAQQAFNQQYKRLNELMVKMTKGTITADEMVEAKQLSNLIK